MAAADANWITLNNVNYSRESFSRIWLLALATYGVGDIVTTIAIVWYSPLHAEANPIVNAAIATFGGGGFLALKLLVFYTCIGISLWGGVLDDDRFLFYLPPVVLALSGTVTTVFNLNLLL